MKKLISTFGISLFIFSACTSAPQPEEEDTPPINEPPIEEEWLTYSNPEYGVSFDYPPNFNLDVDVRYEYPDGKKWTRINLMDDIDMHLVKIMLEVDLDGYGPHFPDKAYHLEEQEDGKIEITSIEPNEGNEEYKSYTEGVMHAMTSIIESQNGHLYQWQLNFEEGEVDYEPLFQEILSTFTLY